MVRREHLGLSEMEKLSWKLQTGAETVQSRKPSENEKPPTKKQNKKKKTKTKQNSEKAVSKQFRFTKPKKIDTKYSQEYDNLRSFSKFR